MKLRNQISSNAQQNSTTKTSTPLMLKAVALGVAALISACGGGGGDDDVQSTSLGTSAPEAPAEIAKPGFAIPSLGSTSAARVVPDAEAKPIVDRLKATAQANSTNFQQQSLVIDEDSEELFNWAERVHSAFFVGKQPNQFEAPYNFRFYPLTGNYAGVANGRVYTLGPMNNGALVDHGTLESFACQFKPDRCSAPGMLNSVPTPTYPAGSDVLEAFNHLNKERQRCGFGMLKQSAALDRASDKHRSYIEQNFAFHQGFTHFQIPGRPGFTGVSPTDRALLEGYGSRDKTFVSENIGTSAYVLNESIFGRGGAAKAVKRLLAAPYHGQDIISSYQDVGYAFGPANRITYRNGEFQELNVLTLKIARVDNLTNANNPQDLTADAVRTYPCQGSTGIQPFMDGENPNPVTPRDLATNPIGSSVLLKVKMGNTILVTSASMNEVATGAPVALLPTLTRANDPNPGYLFSNAAIVMADKPMKPMTDYRVNITGTNNGVTFQRTFQFKTGSLD